MTADRNILADQACNAFSALPEDALGRIDPETIRKKVRMPKNGNICFTVFQTFMADRADRLDPCGMMIHDNPSQQRAAVAT